MPPQITAATQEDLHLALTASGRFSPLYPAGALRLSNHLPMLLTALARLGAPPQVLVQHLARVTPRLTPWAHAPDDAEALARWEHRAAGRPLPELLAEALPGLLQAPETSAFHGMIRMAYALDAGHGGEIARALAAWSHHRWSLGNGALPPAGRATSLRAALAAAAQADGLAFKAPVDTTIVQDMKACAGLPGWAHFAQGEGAPADEALTPEAFAEASLGAYLATRDFTALHLVTATHAWRSLAQGQGLAGDPALRRRLWRAWFTTWLTIGRPLPDWQAVHHGPASEAIWAAHAPALFASRDEHRIKLAWSALCEWRHRGWPGYARVLDGER